MKRYRFKKIDAFATEKSDGNPAGYILLHSFSDIDEGEMQAIARELKGYVNEVGFAARTGGREFTLRYFSAEREVDFCGHATIAIAYDLLRGDAALRERGPMRIRTSRGVLEVEDRIDAENAVFIMAPEPVVKEPRIDGGDIAAGLRIRRDDMDAGFPVAVINAGLDTLLVPVRGLDAVLGMAPDIEELKWFCEQSGLDIIEAFSTGVSDSASDYRVRVFAPRFGYLEDPATGSGNSAFGYYLARLGKFAGETVTVEQNAERDRFNVVRLRRRRDEKGNERVMFGGGAVTRLEGEYILY